MPSAPRFLSAVVCTADRPGCLAPALRALAADLATDPAAEIIVVDNGSTTTARRICLPFAEGGTPLRYVREPKRGLIHARNAGLTAARPGLVAYIDDDAEVDPGWAAALRRAYEEHWDGRRPIAIGGPVRLVYPANAPRPVWLTDTLEVWLTRLDHGPIDLALDDCGDLLVGANFSSPREVLQACGGFRSLREDLGYYDERMVEAAIRRSGGCLVYAAAASVRHNVQPERLSREWFIRRLETEGYMSELFADHLRPRSQAHLAARFAKKAARYLGRNVYQRLSAPDTTTFLEGSLRLADNRGRLRALLSLLRPPTIPTISAS